MDHTGGEKYSIRIHRRLTARPPPFFISQFIANPAPHPTVNPYHKPASLLSLNPRGLVPTLQYANKPLYESTVLVQFLEDAFPGHDPHILPADAYERARARIWSDWVTSRFIPAYHRFLQYQSKGDGDEGLSKKREEFLNLLKEFVKEMAPPSQGPFFLGPDFTLVDIQLAPWALRLWVFDRFKGGLGIPEKGQGGEDEEVWERWRVWVDAVSSRKSVKETMSEREFYLPIYQRYAEDRAQSELAKATREGKGVP
jgi:glutathione S-transferase